MIDEATAAAAPVGAGTAAEATATPVDNGSQTGAAASPFTGLQDAGDRDWVGTKGYKDLDSVVKDARFADKLKGELDTLKGQALTPPGENATPEEWAAFHAKLGRPENPDGYDFAMPQGLPENVPYDSESAKAFKGWSHAAGLTPKQAQIIHDNFVKDAASRHESQIAAVRASTEAAHAELTKVWGDPSSDGYAQNLSFANRFIANNGDADLVKELTERGILNAEGGITSPRLAQAMAKAGKALYAEDGFVNGGVPTQRLPLERRLFPND